MLLFIILFFPALLLTSQSSFDAHVRSNDLKTLDLTEIQTWTPQKEINRFHQQHPGHWINLVALDYPMHLVAATGNLSILKYQIESCKKSPNEVISFGKFDNITPLMLAAEYDNLEGVRYLLNNNAQVNVRASNNWTALEAACENNNTEILKLLIAHGAHANDITNREYPLIKAIKHYNVSAVKLILSTRPKFYCIDLYRTVYNPQHEALPKIVRELLLYGIYVINHPLLNIGKKEDILSTLYETFPIDESVKYSYHTNYVNYMFQEFVDNPPSKEQIQQLVNKEDCDGNTFLFYTATQQGAIAVNYLLSHGAPAFKKNIAGKNVLQYLDRILTQTNLSPAARQNYREILHLLCTYGWHRKLYLQKLPLCSDVKKIVVTFL